MPLMYLGPEMSDTKAPAAHGALDEWRSTGSVRRQCALAVAEAFMASCARVLPEKHGRFCFALSVSYLELSVHAANLRYQGHHKTMFEYGEYSYVVICKRFS
jgi:hypothetical protein